MTLQAGSAIPSTPVELILSASLPTKVVLAILAVLSLLSWGVILSKWLEFRRMARTAQAFMREFAGVTKLDQAAALAKRATASPFTRITARAVSFLLEIRPLSVEGGEPVRTRLNAAQVEALHQVLEAEFTVERERLGAYVPTLAVIGSASPLLGLFGTVLGVINAFLGLASKGSGNLSAVAPGVAEALTATAAALAVAVPAVFAYNVYAARLNKFDGELDGFGADIVALLAREGRI
ncbi:MAG TPA: MotA/TolQ/ExbB proton channel family protein [Gemmatimonadaceae bacterium]|nr:MotA/TolQ/ExbB proton channel family protein [Gemmatimonadaceae bacterium]